MLFHFYFVSIKNQKKYLDIYNKYWSKFETKTDVEKAQRTITPADGI